MDEAQIKRDIAVVCKCKAIRHKTIRLAIEQGAESIEAVRRKTEANTGCGKDCLEKIQEMIALYSRSGK